MILVDAQVIIDYLQTHDPKLLSQILVKTHTSIKLT